MTTPQEKPKLAAGAEPRAPRSKLGLLLSAAGFLCLLVAIFDLTTAGHGSRVLHDFAERRSYNMVKTGVHQAFPRVLLTALAGALLFFGGRRLSQRQRKGTG